MIAPRTPLPEEMDAVAALCDRSFFGGKEREMFRRWPITFGEDNRHNLFVCVEDGRVLSHAASHVRAVLLEGAATRAACIGAVCTEEAARGRGLATACVEAICGQAHANGCDFVLISGGLPIYRRMGAADCGVKCTAVVDATAARALARPGLRVEPATPDDIPALTAIQARAATRFVRARDDWDNFFSAGMCIDRWATLWRVLDGPHEAAYAVVTNDLDAHGIADSFECAGEPAAIAGALGTLLERCGGAPLRLHLGGHETTLIERLRAGGADLAFSHHDFGTTLLLDAPRLVERLRPAIAARAGLAFSRTVSAEADGERFSFHAGGESLTVEGKVAAAQVLFGHPAQAPLAGALGAAWPVCAPWYGLNFL